MSFGINKIVNRGAEGRAELLKNNDLPAMTAPYCERQANFTAVLEL